MWMNEQIYRSKDGNVAHAIEFSKWPLKRRLITIIRAWFKFMFMNFATNCDSLQLLGSLSQIWKACFEKKKMARIRRKVQLERDLFAMLPKCLSINPKVESLVEFSIRNFSWVQRILRSVTVEHLYTQHQRFI